MSHTKDEHFVLSLYDVAMASGDVENSFDRYEIGEKANINPKAVDAICKLLIQANFIKKRGESEIYLTPHGENLAKTLLDEYA